MVRQRRAGRAGTWFGAEFAGGLRAEITDLDPLEFDLLFRTFPEPGAMSRCLTDFGVDCMEKRDGD